MNSTKQQIITKALNNAIYLISEEYQSLQDEELKQSYDRVLGELKNALGLLDG